MKYLNLFILASFFYQLSAQTQVLDRPNVVVGVVIDQMRYDYLYRYWERFGDKGFKRLLKEGSSFENTRYNYVPTYTGPGHCSIYSGTTPRYHGIVANDWYNVNTKQNQYCVDDSTVLTIGSSSKEGKKSPRTMLTTNLSDQLKFATNYDSKVFGVALKDRSSILPAGHSANAAYWFDKKEGVWITSDFYMRTLPNWVKEINAAGPGEQYIGKYWNLSRPLNSYIQSTKDDESWESKLQGENSPIFPHKLNKKDKNPYEVVCQTPYGNDLTAAFAKSLLINEKLGKGKNTDLLAVSFSSPDLAGHLFGPNSVELEDMYIKLDSVLADFFTFLDKEVGNGKYLLFLTADHGASPIPQFLQTKKVPAGLFDYHGLEKMVNTTLNTKYGENAWVSKYINQQFYLDEKLIEKSGFAVKDFENVMKDAILSYKGVMEVALKHKLSDEEYYKTPLNQVQNGFLSQRCGNVVVIYQPNYFDGEYPTGTTHGSNYDYDTHVPLIFMGWGVAPGKFYNDVDITDIAPTIAAMLKINRPNSSIGKVILPLK